MHPDREVPRYQAENGSRGYGVWLKNRTGNRSCPKVAHRAARFSGCTEHFARRSSHSTSSRLFVDKIAINDEGDKLSYFQRNPYGTFHPIAPGHVLYRFSSTAAVLQYHLDEPYLRFRLKKFHSYVRDTPTDESIVFRRMTEEEAERERVFLNLRNLRIAFQETWRDGQRGGYANALLDRVKTSDRIFVPGPETYGVGLAGGEEKRFSLNEDGHFPEEDFFIPEDAEALFAEGDFADFPLTLTLPH